MTISSSRLAQQDLAIFSLTFSATGSATGPAEFSLQYSTTGAGGTFITFSPYVIDDTPGFSAGTYQAAHQFSFDLTGVEGTQGNNADVVFVS